MKVMLSGLVCGVLVCAAPARAAEVQPAFGDQARMQKQVERAIFTQQVEVKRLQVDVVREESRTRQADAKLKQQDQQIANLQRQLEALQAAPQRDGHP